MAEKKVKTSFTLSQTCKNLLGALSEWHGISMASVIEMIVREEARSKGLFPGVQLEGTDHESDRGMAKRSV